MRGAGEDRSRSRAHCCRRPAPGRASRARRCPAPRAKSCGASAASAARTSATAVELLIVDRDQFGGVLRLREAFGDHQRDRLADMHHALARERRAERHDQLGAVAADERRMQRGRADAGRVQVLCGSAPRRRRARRAPPRCRSTLMRACACGERTNTRVSLVRLRRVLDEAAEPPHQRVVLHARLEMMVVLRSPDPRAVSAIRLASHTTQSSNINGAPAREWAGAQQSRGEFSECRKARGSRSLYRPRAAAPRGRAARRRRGPLHRRRAPAGRGARGVRALAARACGDPRHRRGGGARDARRARGADRRGLSGGGPDRHPPAAGSGRRHRLQAEGLRAGLGAPAVRHAAMAARDRDGALCRRAARGGDRRDAGCGARCGGGGRRSTTTSCPPSPMRSTRSRRARRCCTTRCRTTSRSKPNSASAPRPRRHSRKPRSSSSTRSATSASSTPRWSRAPRSALRCRAETATR